MSTRVTVFNQPEWLSRCGIYWHLYREVVDDYRLYLDIGETYGIHFPLRAPWRIYWEPRGGWHVLRQIKWRGRHFWELEPEERDEFVAWLRRKDPKV